jgi:glutamyl-tRNA synthetase
LIDKGEAYYCFCDKERLASLKTQIVEGKEITVYDKHCLSLSKEEVEEKLKAGIPYVIRQNNPTEGTTTFHDEIYGNISIDNSELDDMILIKSDGYPTYNFANVVDDHLMGITHVVRGNEYLSSSPKYNRLYDAFGWEVPVYIHCPLITDEEHHKLSKRCGHSSYEDLIEQGFLTEAVVNFVSLLGWSPSESNKEIFSLAELVDAFDYHHMSKSPAVFDYTKLKWMNGEYIKAMNDQDFYERAEQYLKQAVTKDLDLHKIAAMVKTRIETFPDIPELVDFFQKLPEYDASMYEHKKMKTTKVSSLEVLKELYSVLEEQTDYSNDALYQLLISFVEKKGCKNGYVLWPVRTAVSGKQMTPAGATEIMEIIGKEETLDRIRKGIALLERAQ